MIELYINIYNTKRTEECKIMRTYYVHYAYSEK